MIRTAPHDTLSEPAPRIFYGWWIVAAAFLNLFCSTGVIYYGFPVFYPALVESLGFTRAQVTQGFLLGFIIVGLPFGYLAGLLIDRSGARRVILLGVAFIGLPLIFMGFMNKFWQYEILCLFEVLGYVFAGPIANQVLISQWFRLRRGRAMGYAYLGLGLGGVFAPPAANFLIHTFGWRYALEAAGTLILLVLFPVGFFVTESTPADMGLLPDGTIATSAPPLEKTSDSSMTISQAIRTANFWFILAGSALVIGAINTVIQHFILFLQDHGHSRTTASHFLSVLLASSLAGRVVVGYIADRFVKKNAMALFYLVIGAAIPLLFLADRPLAAWSFAVTFGFAMGADYMLIPLVTAECFGVGSLGKLLALLIMGYSVGQWVAPWMAGKIFDTYHNYDLAWKIIAACGILGAAAIYTVRVPPSLSTAPD
ncbi:MFS transporter [Granulicella sp. dw_53]|uniref:MFS transporter n=1 Tax=Granulicella sp. dw_53 TaxID=2719792 RepID=UPI001BD3E672|nr:MFS transporter [Granulicella sp. dw_53]